MTDDRRARLVFDLTALAVLAGVVVQVYVSATTPLNLFDWGTKLSFTVFAHFTVWSNLLVGVTCALLAANPDQSSPAFRVLRLIGLVAITVTFLVLHTVLSRLSDLDTSAQVANQLLHTLVPVLALAGRWTYGPRGGITAPDVRLTMLFPGVYMIFTAVPRAFRARFPPLPVRRREGAGPRARGRERPLGRAAVFHTQPGDHRGRPAATGPYAMRSWAAALVVLLLATACSPGKDRFVAATPGRLCVATALPAPGFWEGTDGGFERQLAGALADRLSLAGVRVVDVPLQELVNRVPEGCDVGLSQLVATTSRRERAAYTSGYLRVDLGVVTAHGTKVPDLRAARDLVWAVEEGSTGAAVVAAALPHARVLALPGIEATLTAVTSGQAQAAALDLPLALIATADRPGLTVSARFARADEYAIQVRSGRPHEQIDQALLSLVADGTVDRLERRWLTDRYRQNPDDIPVLVTKDLPVDLP